MRPSAWSGMRSAVTVAALFLLAAWSTIAIPTAADATARVQSAYSLILEGTVVVGCIAAVALLAWRAAARPAVAS